MLCETLAGFKVEIFSGGTTDAFVIRGFEAENILQDGLQIDRNSQRVQTENIERVEVVKGPAALLTGQSQPSGTVNIITKKPKAESRHVLTSTFDEHGRKELMLDTTGKLGNDETFLYRLVAAINESETFRKSDKDAEVSRQTDCSINHLEY